MAAFRPRVWATGLRVVEGDSIDGIWNLMYLIRGLWKNGTPRLYRLESQPQTRKEGITGLIVRILFLSRKTFEFQQHHTHGALSDRHNRIRLAALQLRHIALCPTVRSDEVAVIGYGCLPGRRSGTSIQSLMS